MDFGYYAVCNRAVVAHVARQGYNILPSVGNGDGGRVLQQVQQSVYYTHIGHTRDHYIYFGVAKKTAPLAK